MHLKYTSQSFRKYDMCMTDRWIDRPDHEAQPLSTPAFTDFTRVTSTGSSCLPDSIKAFYTKALYVLTINPEA